MTDIPYGYCQCGCGLKTKISTRNRKRDMMVKGQPMRYVFRHSSIKHYRFDLPEINPSGLCMCGCGRPTPISKRTRLENGRYRSVAGMAQRFIQGHGNIRTGRKKRQPKHKRVQPKQRYTVMDCGYITPCWVWKTSKNNPYGVIGKNRNRAHRWFYEQKYGKIPEEFEAHHLCENKSCVNPDHIEPLSRSEHKKWHYVHREGMGSRVPHKLTDQKVHEIRKSFADGVYTRPQLAKMYKVTPQYISQLIRNLWRKE